ncbi:hypothetical protein GA0115242_1048151 [Streptomyces sp. SolWspMP-5a-2]|nr:hypothetical protein GA0115242_1048151 [Streptomyces sp. SolWspMP-5a-2]
MIVGYRLAGSSVLTCTAGGILIADGVFTHTWETAAIGTGLLAVGATAMLAAVVQHALARFAQRNRRELGEVADQRRELELEMQRRESAVAGREQALKRSQVTLRLLMGSRDYALDEAREENRRLREQVASLQAEMDEVNDERNRLIAQELTMASEQFTGRAYGSLQAVAGGATTAACESEQAGPSAEVAVLFAHHGREHR